MPLLPVFSVFLLAVQLHAKNVNVQVVNKCSFPVWPGILNGLPGLDLPENGGFKLNPGESKSLSFSPKWQGRVWARTGCDETTYACETGSCKGALQCAGSGGVRPASLAEFRFDGDSDQDFYDVSLVDGYNVPVLMQPVQGTYKISTGTPYDCTPVGQVNSDILAVCPTELQVVASGKVVGCKSACTAFNTDYFCCTGAFDDADICVAANWPKNYPKLFKDASPTSYSYAYDDAKSTFTCRGASSLSPDYLIQFC